MRLLIALLLLALCFTIVAAEPPVREPHHTLQELTVSKRTKEKYTKKGNPAVAFIEKVMANRHLTDPRQTNDFYQYGQYERIKIGLLDFPIDSAGALGFLAQYLDESPLSGGQVLNLTVKEKVSDVYFRREPQTQREVVRLRNRHGLDDMIADAQSMQLFAEDILGPVDLYGEGDITILHSKYVSPLGRIATDFYKFYLSDTIADPERGDSLIVVSFLPHNPSVPGFNGRIYVEKDDSLTFIRRAELRLPKAANVNYVSDMRLLQEYDRAPDGSRLKSRDEILIEMSALGQKAFASRLTVYNSHGFTPPRDSTLFSDPREVIERETAGANIVRYRPVGAQYGESNMDRMVADMNSRKFFRYSAKFLRTLVDDRIKIVGPEAKVAYGPIFSTVSVNDLEGVRLRGGFGTTAYLSPRWFGNVYGAYGFRDHRWKYGADIEFSFNRKKQHAMEFPIRSLKLSHDYDVDKLGQSYSSGDAIFNSVSFNSNKLLTYRRRTALDFTWETYAGLSFRAEVALHTQEASRLVKFTDGYGRNYRSFNQALGMLELRWAPNEKFYQSSKSRRTVGFYGPIVRLTHTYGPKGMMGALTEVNKTEASIEHRFWLSAWGHLDVLAGGGHVWSRTDFTSLLTPRANLSFLIGKHSFMLMNAMEFLNDSYASLSLEYQARGAFFNYIPLLKRLKLREIVGFRSIWGHLSANNDPANHPELLRFPTGAAPVRMGAMPYMEFNVGIENILTIFRVDYVRRLSYLGSPNIKRNGVRFSIHLTF